MGRQPVNDIPQARLVYELKVAIDRARFINPGSTPDPAAWRRLRDLIERNPYSTHSSHVRYNLGRERVRWLDAFEANAMSLRTE